MITMLAGPWAGCAVTALPSDSVCAQTGTAVAARVLECTGDPEAANAAFTNFNANYTCGAATDDRTYACNQAVRRAGCGDATADAQEMLFKRAAPVCSRILHNAPSSPQVILAPGQASAQGTFNGAAVTFNCVFGPTPLTEVGVPGDIRSVVGSTLCAGGTFGFLLSLSHLAPGTYTDRDGAVPQLGPLSFAQLGGPAAGPDRDYALTIVAALLDPDGYARVQGRFTVTHADDTTQYQLNGTFDVVLQPPS